MCGRFYLIEPSQKLIKTFFLQRLPRYETSYNIPPGQKILTIVKLDDGNYKAVNLHWGLIPYWSKDSRISHHLINARAETVAEKPAFKAAYKQRRCLIPATGFYEWQKREQGKQAYGISKNDQTLITFAGLWEYWEHGTETIYSCTIITTTANQDMQVIHPRMPVIINQHHHDDWLDKQTPFATIQPLLASDEGGSLAFKPVSDWVNNPRHNDPLCLN